MAAVEDLVGRSLVVASHAGRAETVFLAAVRAASAPDGLPLDPRRVDPLRTEAHLDDDVVELLLGGGGVLADLADVGPRLFRVLAWEARIQPSAVAFFRHGRDAFPLDLHAFAVRSYDATTPEGAAEARREIARLATLAAWARARNEATGSVAPRPRLALRRRREASGVAQALRHAVRRLFADDLNGAIDALAPAVAGEPGGADLLLRRGVLLREAGHWAEARAALERVVALEPGRAPAWRELGIVLDREGDDGAEAALRRAVTISSDYRALVSLGFLQSRRGEGADALGLLERALSASEGHLNLVLPVAVLRAAHAGHTTLDPLERARLEEVLTIRGAQAGLDGGGPPEDAPWSHYDAAQACLLLGRCDAALRLAGASKAHVSAPWQPETFGRALDALERAGLDVAPLRAAAGVRPRRPDAAREAVVPTGPPFPAAVPDAHAFHRNVPCASACPVGTDAGAYVTLIAQAKDADAFRVARGPNPFASVCGRVCAAPCEDACRRGKIDEPVAIRPLKRFLTEKFGAESDDPRLTSVLDGSVAPGMEGEAYISHLKKRGAGTGSGRRVAVVGGGPSGLACAHDLAFLGHRVTVFEATDQLGGMMRLGIPEYRLPRAVMEREIDAILELGVEVRTRAGLSAERPLSRLFDEGFEAVFLASGAGRGRDLEVEGSDLDGVVRAIDFLINVNTSYRATVGDRVLVVGGGNVALDVARTARRGQPPSARAPTGPDHALPGANAFRAALTGIQKEVHVVARQPFGEWPAQKSVHGREEVEEAKREGVMFHPLRGVRRILGEHGRVVAVELAEVVSLRDDRGRYAPVYGAHAAETIPVDTVFLAVGQEPDLDYLGPTTQLRRTKDGLIEVDRETLATTLPGVYAGGDAAFGPRTLIEAVAEGKRAARSMHRHLCGDHLPPWVATFSEIHPREAAPADDYDRLPRVDPSCVDLARRTGVAEVEGGYDEAEARRQASRCLACHVQTIYDGDLCVACGRCTDVCPHRCLSLVAAGDVDPAGLASLARPDPDLVMVKDETACIRCGLCAERCPTGAMRMERLDWKVADAATTVAR